MQSIAAQCCLGATMSRKSGEEASGASIRDKALPSAIAIPWMTN